MYIEKRKVGKNIKYYLVHSYREGKNVEKIRKRRMEKYYENKMS